MAHWNSLVEFVVYNQWGNGYRYDAMYTTHTMENDYEFDLKSLVSTPKVRFSQQYCRKVSLYTTDI